MHLSRTSRFLICHGKRYWRAEKKFFVELQVRKDTEDCLVSALKCRNVLRRVGIVRRRGGTPPRCSRGAHILPLPICWRVRTPSGFIVLSGWFTSWARRKNVPSCDTRCVYAYRPAFDFSNAIRITRRSLSSFSHHFRLFKSISLVNFKSHHDSKNTTHSFQPIFFSSLFYSILII